MNDIVATRVARGVSALDQIKPEWRTLINLEALDMTDPAVCVLGQTFEDPDPNSASGWSRAQVALGAYLDEHPDIREQIENTEDTGVVCIVFGFEHDWDAGYEELHAAWLEQI